MCGNFVSAAVQGFDSVSVLGEAAGVTIDAAAVLCLSLNSGKAARSSKIGTMAGLQGVMPQGYIVGGLRSAEEESTLMTAGVTGRVRSCHVALLIVCAKKRTLARQGVRLVQESQNVMVVVRVFLFLFEVFVVKMVDFVFVGEELLLQGVEMQQAVVSHRFLDKGVEVVRLAQEIVRDALADHVVTFRRHVLTAGAS